MSEINTTSQKSNLPSGWRVVELGDVCEKVVTGGTPLSSDKSFYENGHIPWLNTKEVDFCRIHFTKKNITQLGLEKSSVKYIPKNCVIVAMYGATAGKVAINKIPLTTNQACCNLSVNIEEANYNFVYYYLSINHQKLLNLANGAAQQNLNTRLIKNLKFNLPPLPEQKAIAHILGKLDDKIELNRQINQTLETMAQMLFKSWFVDFDPVIDNAIKAGNKIPKSLQHKADKRKTTKSTLPKDLQALFPDSFVFNDTLKKWIPQGWEVKNAEDIAEVSIGKTPPRKEQYWFETSKNNDNQTWISIRNMGGCGVFISDSHEYLTNKSISKFNVKLVPTDTVILSFKLTVGRVAITSKQLCTNEAIAHFTNPKFGLNSNYLFCYLKIFNYDSLGSTSSIATAVNSKIIKKLPVLTPDKKILDLFIVGVGSYFDKIKLTTNEITTLTKLRNILLPKLISGKIRVPYKL